MDSESNANLERVMRRDFRRLAKIVAGGIIVFGVAMAAILLAGCSVITPSDASYFDISADNAAAVNALAQQDANIAPGLRRWIDLDAECRAVESKWAHGKSPLTRPAK